MGNTEMSCAKVGAMKYQSLVGTEAVIARTLARLRPFDLQVGDYVSVPSPVKGCDYPTLKVRNKVVRVTAIYPHFFMTETIGNKMAEYKESFLIKDYRLGWIKKYEQ